MNPSFTIHCHFCIGMEPYKKALGCRLSQGGGYFTKLTVVGSARDKKWNQLDLRFCKIKGSNRSKTNEKEASIGSKIKEKIYATCLKVVKY